MLTMLHKSIMLKVMIMYIHTAIYTHNIRTTLTTYYYMQLDL